MARGWVTLLTFPCRMTFPSAVVNCCAACDKIVDVEWENAVDVLLYWSELLSTCLENYSKSQRTAQSKARMQVAW